MLNRHGTIIKLLIEGVPQLQRAARTEDRAMGRPPLGSPSNMMAKLHEAALSGDKAEAKLLLEKGANIEAQIYGLRAPYIAIACAREGVVELLLQNGADVEAPVAIYAVSGYPRVALL